MDELALRGFERYLLLKGLGEKTRKLCVLRIEKVLEKSSPLTLESAQDYLVGILEQGFTKNTFNKYIIEFRHWCGFTNEKWAWELKFLKEDEYVPQTFTDSEIEAFLALEPLSNEEQDTHYKWTILWEVCAFTGCRTGEILRLKKTDINFGQACIILNNTKTKKGRVIPLLPFVVEHLKTYVDSIPTQYLFTGKKGSTTIDKPSSHASIEKDFKKRLKRLGITRDLRPYNFRHTTISRLLKKAKMNIFEVKRLVGHSQTGTTEKYYSYGSVDDMIESMMLDPLARSYSNSKTKLEQIVSQIHAMSLHKDNDLQVELNSSSEEVLLRVRLK